MTKLSNKMLAFVLSFALIVTNFVWLGTIEAYAAEGNIDTITIHVVDQDNENVAGVSLYAVDTDDHDVDFGTTDSSGLTSYKLKLSTDEYFEPDSEYEIVTDQYTVIEGISFTTKDVDGEDGFFFDTVNGAAYEGETVTMKVQVEKDTPEPQSPVVTFNANGGQVAVESAETAEGKLTNLPEATREGFAFLGWFTAAEGGDAVTTETVFTEDTTVYAQWLDASTWEPADFTYGPWTWGANDGLYCVSNTADKIQPELWVVTGLSDRGKAKVKAGNTKLVVPAADTEGKKVQGVGNAAFQYRSAFQPEGLPKLTEVTLPQVARVPMEKPEWKVNNTKDRGDFFIGASAFLGHEIGKVELPDGVVYIGGSAFNTNSLKEITFPASISYIGSQAFAKNNELATLNFPDKTDLELQIDAGAFGLSIIEAVQMPPTLVKLNKNAFMKAKGQPIVEITIDGKIGEYVDASTYHNVTKISHTVTFDAGEGTTETANAETFKNKLEVLPEATREGFEFLGWFTAAEGGDKVTTETVFTEDATVYAQWKNEKQDAAEAARAEAEEAKKDAEDAKTAAEEAKAASDAAAKTPGQAAIDAADKYVKAADAFAEAADAAVQAANKAVEAAEAAYEEGSEKISDAKKAAEDAAALLTEAEQTKTNAANAKAAAEKGKADADAAKAAADAAAKAAAQQAALQAQYAPGKVVLKKAAKGKKKATVTWKTIKKDVNGYEVQFVDKNTGSVVKTKTFKQTKKLAKKKTIKKTIKGLKKGTYNVQVRAFRTVDGANYYGEWSKVKTAKVN